MRTLQAVFLIKTNLLYSLQEELESLKMGGLREKKIQIK